jgi:hypothetical protein
MNFDFFHQHFFGKQPTPRYDHAASLAQVNAMAEEHGAVLLGATRHTDVFGELGINMFPQVPPQTPTAVQPATATEEIHMATAPVVAAPTENKFETFLSTAAKDIEKGLNAAINITEAEQPLLNQILPANFATAESAATTLIKNVMLQTEAKYAAIGTTVSYGQKVAEVVAITGGALAQILLSIGVTAGQSELTTLVTGATAFGNLQTSGLTTLTAAPVAAPAPTTTITATLPTA